jgi:hypothetical protein
MVVGFRFFSIGIIFIAIISCSGPKIYRFVDSKITYGVNFSDGNWLLNELDCASENKKELTDYATDYFFKNIGNRFSYITDDRNLLLSKKRISNFGPTELSKIQKLTTSDYLINIVAKKNRNELSKVQLYNNKSPGANESEVWFEIYDLRTLEKIFSEHVLGRYSKNNAKSMFEDPNHESQKLMDNIKINVSTKELLIGCLNKILKKLDKTSIKN